MTASQNRKEKEIKQFYGFVRSLIMLFIALWLIFFFVIGVKMAPNDDMSPKINAGDVMLYYKIGKTVTNQDVIVLEKNDTEYVGRIVAKGGDTVEITKEENLVINGNMVAEENIYTSTPQYEGYQTYPVTLAPDEFFVLSDNREGGEDSRYYGPVKQEEIKGLLIGLYRRGGF